MCAKRRKRSETQEITRKSPQLDATLLRGSPQTDREAEEADSDRESVSSKTSPREVAARSTQRTPTLGVEAREETLAESEETTLDARREAWVNKLHDHEAIAWFSSLQKKDQVVARRRKTGQWLDAEVLLPMNDKQQKIELMFLGVKGTSGR